MSKDVKEPKVFQKYRRTKIKTVPGLSITNAELLRRVKERTIVIDSSGQVYSTDPAIIRAARQDKAQNARDYLLDTRKVSELTREVRAEMLTKQFEGAKEQGRKDAAEAAKKEVKDAK